MRIQQLLNASPFPNFLVHRFRFAPTFIPIFVLSIIVVFFGDKFDLIVTFSSTDIIFTLSQSRAVPTGFGHRLRSYFSSLQQ